MASHTVTSTEQQAKQRIREALLACAEGSLATKALALLDALGYRSEKRLDLCPNTPENFLATYDGDGKLNPSKTKGLIEESESVDLLFQLTGEEIAGGSQSRFVFDGGRKVDDAMMESYLFFAVHLRGALYTRGQLATITREINKLFPMPVLVIFQHGSSLTLSIINRRLHKRDESRDVLEKVTLIKDISLTSPHRAHVEILFDLSLEELRDRYRFTNFVELHNAWQKTLDSAELNKRFYREIADWYFWALKNVQFPRDDGKEAKAQNEIGVIRLITRMIFVWFLKEKGLVPSEVFSKGHIGGLLSDAAPKGTAYYRAILQNLFFATLNQEMNTPGKKDRRRFRSPGRAGYNVTNLYRYESYFKDAEAALDLFAVIPFLNGGLFDCLDKPDEANPGKTVRVDGFSDHKDNELVVPDDLFFAEERDIDLNEVYDTKNKHYRVRGLIGIFNRYKFTVEENTPVEEEVALDPELLGQVFENLLASHAPETGVVARKQTGSFYTPREIVNYMVDEALIPYLEAKLTEGEQGLADDDKGSLRERLRHLFAYSDEPHRLSAAETERLIESIDSVKILDPACGSGAFPMGILHKLVFILAKLDPRNTLWKERQLARIAETNAVAARIDDAVVREATLRELARQTEAVMEAFERNEMDYGRKLFLIERCIYGVDIQPIAVQIAKLRCFISLIVDQKVDRSRDNLGIRPLPNLETKFVAANSLLGLGGQLALRSEAVAEKEGELAKARRSHFNARTRETKLKHQARDKELRQEISVLLQNSGLPTTTAEMLARWDPYDQNTKADFFEPEWMFGVAGGFDIVIGNPPYVRQEQITEQKPALKAAFTCYSGTADLYVYFYERAYQLLKVGGVLSYISSNKYFRSAYGEKLRGFLGKLTTVQQIIDFGDAPVFTAISYPTIVVLRKAKPDGHSLQALVWEPKNPLEEFAATIRDRSFPLAQKELTKDCWQLAENSVFRLLEKVRAAGKPLGEYVRGRIYRGIITGLNEAFVVNSAARDRLIAEDPTCAAVLVPFLRGRDVKRWQVNLADQYLIKIESSENKPHPWSGLTSEEAESVFAGTYPAIHAHLDNFRVGLVKRDDQGKYFWELRSCVFWDEFAQPKIVLPAIASNVEYTCDVAGHYCNDKTSFCVTDSIDYLLGLLNSRVLSWFIHQTAATRQGGFLEFKPMYVSQLPIGLSDNSKPIGIIVNKIIGLKTTNRAADVSELEAEIDKLVYCLYGLTAEEIRLVEESVGDRK